MSKIPTHIYHDNPARILEERRHMCRIAVYVPDQFGSYKILEIKWVPWKDIKGELDYQSE